MSLHLGELTIGLQLENDSLRPGIAQAKRELETVAPVAQREVRKISREFAREGDLAGKALAAGIVKGADGVEQFKRDASGRLRKLNGQFATDAEIIAAGLGDELRKSGEKSGSKLAQGINAGLIRNSPLIAAAIGGALVAGAPAALAGASLLFGGVAGIALSQNEAVASSWRGLGQEIRRGAIEDSAIVAPTFVRMADDIGQAFQGLRPQVRDALTAIRPQLDDVSAGVIALAQNAMPGLLRAVESAGPVMEGFGSFLSSTGTGLSGFFDGMSAHAPAAGAAFAAIGDILAELLPTLGNLLGTGAELAATILPPLASALGAVGGALDAIGPILPAIVAGFVGLKAAQGLAGLFNSAAGGLSRIATEGVRGVQMGERLGGAMSGTSRALQGVGTALPILGIGFALLSANMQHQEQMARDNTTAFAGLFTQLSQGGAAAEQGAAGIAAGREAISQWGERGQWGTAIAGQLRDGMESGAEAARDQAAATDVLVSAQQTAEAAQSTLNSAIETYGAGSPEVAAAAVALANANADVASKASAAEQATYGLTTAIAAQLTQALTAASADLSYRDAVDQVQAAQEALTTAVRDHGAASEEADDAGRQLEASMLAQVDAAGRLATEGLPAATDEMTRNAVAGRAQLDELNRLRDTMGGTLPPALEAARASLEATVGSIDQTRVAANVTTGQMQDLGFSVTQLPGSKYIRVDAPTAAQKQQLLDLGYTTRTLPDGDILVLADTSRAESALRAITAPRTMTVVANVIAGLNPFGGAGKVGFAEGGAVRGAGSDTSDSIDARLSNNEHVWTAREVRAAGGHGEVERLRKAVLANRPGFAAGGPVTTSTPVAPSAVALDGMRVTGTFQMDQRGLVTLIDGRLQSYDESGRRDTEYVTGGF